jgi:predicted metalloprotease
MTLNENASVDTSQVRDVGASGGGLGGRGLPIPIGGGGGWIGLVVLLLMVAGGVVGGKSLFGGGGGGGTQTPVECGKDQPDRFNNVKCRDAAYINSIQAYWQDGLPKAFNRQYQEVDTVFFDQSVDTGCGPADSGVGPFYCPEDDLVYIDVSFWNELATRFGAGGTFAQAYVLAHEYGHHVQDLIGTEAQVHDEMQRDPSRSNALSITLELQADCYAGVWAKHAQGTTDANGIPLFTSVTQADVNQALTAAAAVGDDAIQKKMGGSVDESKFTHGSSAQRDQAFNQGFNSGEPKACAIQG